MGWDRKTRTRTMKLTLSVFLRLSTQFSFSLFSHVARRKKKALGNSHYLLINKLLCILGFLRSLLTFFVLLQDFLMSCLCNSMFFLRSQACKWESFHCKILLYASNIYVNISLTQGVSSTETEFHRPDIVYFLLGFFSFLVSILVIVLLAGSGKHTHTDYIVSYFHVTLIRSDFWFTFF